MGAKSTIFERQYKLKEKLGVGNFAIVRKCIDKDTKKEFAVKIIQKGNLSKQDRTLLMDEVHILEKVNHENIVKMHEFYNTDKKFYIVLELLKGGELFEEILRLGKFSEFQASQVIKDAAKALTYLHSLGIVHRDIKPENLLYDEGTIKLTDFGLAKLTRTGLMSSPCGTPGYVAPEILKNLKYTSAVDMWSLGVLLYILLCGFPPFHGDTPAELYEAIKAGRFEFVKPYWSNISLEAKDLVIKLLEVDPKARLSAQEVLKHPWVENGNASQAEFDGLYNKNLKKFNAKRKLRKAITLVLALNKLASTVAALDRVLIGDAHRDRDKELEEQKNNY